MIHAEVVRHGNENVGGVLRRFTRKMQSSGLVKRVRGTRYHSRAVSNAKAKQAALSRLKRTQEYVELQKLGREIPSKKRR